VRFFLAWQYPAAFVQDIPNGIDVKVLVGVQKLAAEAGEDVVDQDGYDHGDGNRRPELEVCHAIGNGTGLLSAKSIRCHLDGSALDAQAGSSRLHMLSFGKHLPIYGDGISRY
jgi:hypothetical protein